MESGLTPNAIKNALSAGGNKNIPCFDVNLMSLGRAHGEWQVAWPRILTPTPSANLAVQDMELMRMR